MNCWNVFQSSCTIYIPTSASGCSFLHVLATLVISLFNFSHLSGCEVASHCGFDLHFPNDEWWWTSCCSVAKSCLTLWPQGLHYARPPCLSPAPGVCSDLCPLSHDAIQPPVLNIFSCACWSLFIFFGETSRSFAHFQLSWRFEL